MFYFITDFKTYTAGLSFKPRFINNFNFKTNICKEGLKSAKYGYIETLKT